MKHTFTLLLLFTAISFQYVHADAFTDQNNSCNIFHRKFRAVTLVKNCDTPWFKCRKGIGDCTYAESYCPYNEEIVPGVNVLHYAKASLGWRTDYSGPFEVRYCCTSETEVNVGFGFCGGNNNLFSPSFYSQSPILILPIEQTKKEVKLTIKETIFDNENRRIILKGITGRMLIQSSDFANDFTTFTISVTSDTRPEAEREGDDTKYYTDHLVWDARVILNNGKLLTNGNFNISDFSFNKENQQKNYISAEFNSEEMTIEVPEGYDMENLVVHNGSDAGNLGYGISEKFEIKNIAQSITIKEPQLLVDKFEFINYPNPVKDKINIQVQLKESSEIKVLLYDLDGNLQQTIFQGKVKAGKALHIEHDLKGVIPKRIYFLKLLTNNKILVRKIIID